MAQGVISRKLSVPFKCPKTNMSNKRYISKSEQINKTIGFIAYTTFALYVIFFIRLLLFTSKITIITQAVTKNLETKKKVTERRLEKWPGKRPENTSRLLFPLTPPHFAMPTCKLPHKQTASDRISLIRKNKQAVKLFLRKTTQNKFVKIPSVKLPGPCYLHSP